MKRLLFVLSLASGSVGATDCSGTVPALTSSAAAHKLTIQLFVHANEPYTDSGVAVQANEQISFAASGSAKWRELCRGRCVVGPNGWSLRRPKCRQLQKSRVFGKFTAPGLPCFSLIGRIGSNSSPFEVGSSLNYTVPASASGELYLGFNDNYYIDNTGGFTAEISY
jgi:hypothetical protein